MEQTELHQNLRSLTQFTRYQFLKKITQFFLSVSVFSLLLSNSSRLSFLPAFSFSSTVPFQLFTLTISKNCMFLLCNGLLVFVAKFSGSITSSSSPKNINHSSIDQLVKNYQDYKPLVLEEKVPLTEKEQDKETHLQNEAEENGNGFLNAGEEEKEIDEPFVQEDYHDQAEVTEFDDKFPVDDQQDDPDADGDYEDEEENEMLSTEELNKKFEEFIRKMKEEIRNEAQQQLMLVN